MPPFVLSPECQSRANCARCRDPAGGRTWRVVMGHKYDLPERSIDFGCPFGKPWAGQQVPAAPIPLTPARLAHGAVGIARAVTGTGGASAETVTARLAICNPCEHAQLTAGVLRRCRLCGCSTWAKVRNAAEQCPAGKWGEGA
jgi:hypothetical protein